jgi:hypothetical protein
MPLRHSYKFYLSEIEASILGLRYDYERTNNPFLLERIKAKEQEASWFRKKIEAGEDPGVIIL